MSTFNLGIGRAVASSLAFRFRVTRYSQRSEQCAWCSPLLVHSLTLLVADKPVGKFMIASACLFIMSYAVSLSFAVENRNLTLANQFSWAPGGDFLLVKLFSLANMAAVWILTGESFATRS